MQERKPGNDRGRDWSETAASQGMPRITSKHQNLERGKGEFLPPAFRESIALLTPWFQTSGFQKSKRMNFCCFKPLRYKGSRKPIHQPHVKFVLLCFGVFFFHLFFRAPQAAYGSSQARGRIGAAAACLHHSQQPGIWAASATYTIAHGNARSLTHWVRTGIKPESSRILIGFITAEPHWELPKICVF